MATKPKPKVLGSYIKLPCPTKRDPKNFMVWPNPLDPAELKYRLRYGPPLTANEQRVAASYLEAYHYLVTALPQRTRNTRCSELKAALKGDS